MKKLLMLLLVVLMTVVLCRVQYDCPDTISVSVDDERVAYDITSHFINK